MDSNDYTNLLNKAKSFLPKGLGELPLIQSYEIGSNPKKVINSKDVISNKERLKNSPNFEDCTCKRCKEHINDKFSWYYLKHKED